MSEKILDSNENVLKDFNEGKILSPKDDIVFQTLFSRGKETITKAFLEDILKIKINKLDLDKTKDLLNNNAKFKNGRVDIRAVLNNNIECDIEMQLSSHENLLERFLYYWAKIYVSNLEIGDDYTKLKKTISIIIVDHEIPEFKHMLKAHTRWQIREEKNFQIVLTPHFQLDIIEIPKALKEYQEGYSDELLKWMVFLNDPECKEVNKIMSENENIKTANEELKKLSMDRELYLAAVRERLHKMDIEQEKKEAVESAVARAKLEHAKKMLDKGIDLDTVLEITGLTKKEIENSLKN